MGLLFNLVTLPVTGPLKATTWVAEQVLDVAERDFYDEDAIRSAMQDAESRYQLGAISEQDYEATVDTLLERLMAAREHRARKG